MAAQGPEPRLGLGLQLFVTRFVQFGGSVATLPLGLCQAANLVVSFV